MHNDFGLLFERWYLGLFLIAFGLWLALRAAQFNDLRRFFRRDELTPEMCDAIERRQALEATPLLHWRVPGTISVVLGTAVMANLLLGVVAYGLAMCALAASLGIGYLQMRNRGTTRAALLAPRTLTTVVPIAWYPAAALVALAPLTFLDVPGLALGAVLVSLSSLATFAFAVASNGMAAIMPGVSPRVEVCIDRRVRRCRVVGLFAICLAVPFVFVAMAAPFSPESPMRTIAYAVTAIAWGICIVPLLIARIHWLRVPQ